MESLAHFILLWNDFRSGYEYHGKYCGEAPEITDLLPYDLSWRNLPQLRLDLDGMNYREGFRFEIVKLSTVQKERNRHTLTSTFEEAIGSSWQLVHFSFLMSCDNECM